MTLAQRDLTDFWAALDTSGDPVRVRNLLLEFFPDLVQSYGDTAAVLGADWYDMLRDVPASASSFNAVLAAPVVTEQAQSSVRWAVGPLFDADPDTALAQLLGSAQRLVLQPGRDTVWESVRADPVKTYFARMPSGVTTCQWCVMLASRGFDYSSDFDAGQGREFHDNCDCVIIPGRGPDALPESYDLDLYKRLYAEASGIGENVDM